MNTQTRIITTLTAAVALLVLAIGAGSFLISYEALKQTGLTGGIPAPLGWLWPLLIDAPLIVFTLALLISQIMRQSAKLWAGLVILYTLATVGFNLSHAQPSALGWTVAIVAPVGLLLTTEALRHLARGMIERQATVQTLAELVTIVTQRRAELDKLNGQTEAAAVKLEQVRSELKAAQIEQKTGSIAEMNAAKQAIIEQRRAEVLALLGQGKTPSVIADELQVSLSTIKRDLTALNGAAVLARGMAQ